MLGWYRFFPYLIALTVLTAGTSIAVPQAESRQPQKVLQDSINGSTFEIVNGASSERYAYDAVNLEKCALKWTEEHETWESGKRTFREVTETTAPLDVIDEKQMTPNKLKNGGYVVSLQTKGLENQILTRLRTQWGDDPETNTTGISSGAGLYFRNREVAEKVSTTIGMLIRPCQGNHGLKSTE